MGRLNESGLWAVFWEDGSQLDRRGLRAGIRAWEARQMRATCGAVLPQAWSLGKVTRASHGASLLGCPSSGL